MLSLSITGYNWRNPGAEEQEKPNQEQPDARNTVEKLPAVQRNQFPERTTLRLNDVSE
jgi:hypothetical protein